MASTWLLMDLHAFCGIGPCPVRLSPIYGCCSSDGKYGILIKRNIAQDDFIAHRGRSVEGGAE